jgi:hypothetical protein
MGYLNAGQDMDVVRTALDIIIFKLNGILIQLMSIVHGWSVKK